MIDEFKNLDLSSKTFGQFVRFFFARRVVSDKEHFDYFLTDLDGQRYDDAVPSSPEILVGHMTKLFSEFGDIAPQYSLPQIDQAIWSFLGAYFRLYELLFVASVPLSNRLQCIRSMYCVYSDFVARLEADPDLTGFFMWWDLVLHGFWTPPKSFVPGTNRGDASKLDAESRMLLDAMFETLVRILDVPNIETQRCALHGLGHLHHPEVHGIVQRYIDTNKSAFDLAWLNQCREGTVL